MAWASPDRPDRLIGDNHVRGLGAAWKAGGELAHDHLFGLAGLALGQRLADAHDRGEPGGERGFSFRLHHRVALVMAGAAFAVAHDDMGAPKRLEHGGRDVAGVRAGLMGRTVLSAEQHPVRQPGRDRMDQRGGRAQKHVAAWLIPNRIKQFFTPRQGVRIAVHLPVSGDQSGAAHGLSRVCNSVKMSPDGARSDIRRAKRGQRTAALACRWRASRLGSAAFFSAKFKGRSARMLSAIRKAARSPIFGGFIIALLIAAFALFGVTDIFRAGGTAAVIVGPEQVSVRELNQAYERQLMQIQRENPRFTREQADELGLGERMVSQVRGQRLADLAEADAASAILGLKVCDPAMGSGHFLVSLVDYLADKVIQAMADAEALVTWAPESAPYVSPLSARIERIRGRILERAAAHDWIIGENQLEPRLIVRRMILKRVIYGVDKNPMAVELAKVALWLHTFTVGAPLSFLDHHLRCGDSLFGEWVRPVTLELQDRGDMFLFGPIGTAKQAARSMSVVEDLTDTDIAEVQHSKAGFEDVTSKTGPLARFLSFWHARRWLGLDGKAPRRPPNGAQDREPEDKRRKRLRHEALDAFMDGTFGDPLRVLAGTEALRAPASRPEPGLLPDDRPLQAEMLPAGTPDADTWLCLRALLDEADALAGAERFLHWEVAFPGVWTEWESTTPKGGFDAVIGNPPYIRQELLGRFKPMLQRTYATYDGVADLYVYFYEQGLTLLRPGGRLSLVVTNKWLRAGYGEPLRRLFRDRAWMDTIIDFGHAKQFFRDADVFPSVIVARRPERDVPAPERTRVCVIPRETLRLDAIPQQVDAEAFDIPRASLGSEPWRLEPAAVIRLLDKIRDAGVPLVEYAGVPPCYGIKTGLNDAFLIDTPTKDRLVAEDPKSADIIRPYLRGQDVKRWAADWAGQWMIVMKSSSDHPWPWAEAGDGAEAIFRAEYPALFRHLRAHKEKLGARQDQGRYWWELRPCAYYDLFGRKKIVFHCCPVKR